MGASPKAADRARFGARAAAGDLDAIVRDLMGGVHHGRPGRPTAVKREAVRALRAAGDAARRLAWGRALARRPEYVAREVACALLDESWPAKRALLEPLLLALADDPDWEVRECAAGLFARALERDFEATRALLADWTRHPSENVRRAVALAAKSAALDRDLARAGPLLDLLEPLLADPSAYVKKNLGPFAIGDGLLRCHPGPTLARLRRCARSPDATVRWNVAAAFGAAAAARHVDAGLSILGDLAADDRPAVRRAVISALKKLLGREPERVRAALERWRDQDAGRAVVAGRALAGRR